ncbi:MAG: hypothetical protein JSW66_08900 [Phycisphaerales bacterium]|nr:MAG: hypothetical protein JSW66_08900 [Phycisphaerales bacterium]
MRAKKSLLAITAGILCCMVGLWFSASIQGGQKTYELEPRLTIPEYKTDVVRIMDAYERLMERYMGLTESNLSMIAMDLRTVGTRLDSIDAKLTELSARVMRIEQALGIDEQRSSSGVPLRSRPDDLDTEVSLERAR